MQTLTLPHGLEATVRGMTGREEDLLTDRKKVMSGAAVDELLVACTKQLGDVEQVKLKDVTTLPTADRHELLLAIRIESFGPMLDADLECINQDCREHWNVDVDLSTAITRVPALSEELPYRRVLSTGDTVVFTDLTGDSERRLMKRTEGLLTEAMFMRLISVEGVHDNDLKRWLLDLPAMVRSELREIMQKTDCGPEVVLTADCPTCGNETQFNVMRTAGFFFPKA